MTKEYHDMEEHKKLLKPWKEFEDKNNNFEDICREIMKE